jgi:predicted aspartyl protease
MGIIDNNIRLANPYFPDQEEINVDALVDTGATHLCIPEHIALQLKLITLKER